MCFSSSLQGLFQFRSKTSDQEKRTGSGSATLDNPAIVYQVDPPPPGYARVPYLALQGADELTILGEDGEVEVVVIVRDGDLPRTVDAHPDGIVGDA